MKAHTDEETMVLKVFNDRVEADVARQKLEEEGITAVLVDENAIGLNPLGGIELKIFTKDLGRAKELIGPI